MSILLLIVLLLSAYAFGVLDGLSRGKRKGERQWRMIFAFVLSQLTREERANLKQRLRLKFEQRSSK